MRRDCLRDALREVLMSDRRGSRFLETLYLYIIMFSYFERILVNFKMLDGKKLYDTNNKYTQ